MLSSWRRILCNCWNKLLLTTENALYTSNYYCYWKQIWAKWGLIPQFNLYLAELGWHCYHCYLLGKLGKTVNSGATHWIYTGSCICYTSVFWEIVINDVFSSSYPVHTHILLIIHVMERYISWAETNHGIIWLYMPWQFNIIQDFIIHLITYALVAECLNLILSGRSQNFVAQITDQWSPSSPDPFSPNALTSWLWEIGDWK